MTAHETRPLGGQRSTRSGKRGGHITFFDLDHTLLSGDSDVLWCEFLMARGVLDPSVFGPRNRDMDARYRSGTVGLEEFAHFYVGTLAGKTPESWEPLRQQFLQEMITPRIGEAARALVREHQEAGDLVVMTTATNRFITELTASHLGITHLIATEPQLYGGVFSGRTVGTLNMREGKVVRLHEWLSSRGEELAMFESTAYSDSINDLPLLSAVACAVAVDPDASLQRIARERDWRILHLPR
jgi:HAD superfamily hydrolase (TIGR01490 family)